MPKLLIPLVLTLAVWPGAGHLFLKRWARGAAWMAAFSFPLLPVVWIFGTSLSQFLDAAMSPTGEVPAFDLSRLGAAAAAAGLSFLAYIGAAVDCWRLTRINTHAPESSGLNRHVPDAPRAE